VARVAVGPPLNGVVEIAGPQRFHLDDLVRQSRSAHHDPRDVVTDPHAAYLGAELHERPLVPADDAQLAQTRFDHWLSQAT
jgi:uncharacterized protein YbjT (DUF2867 family)